MQISYRPVAFDLQHARDFLEEMWPNDRRRLSARLQRPNKMAAATEAFVNAVQGALANAEVEMVNNRADKEKT